MENKEVIDADRALAMLERAVEIKGANHVNTGGCRYFSQGHVAGVPLCIVGVGLADIGVTLADIGNWGNNMPVRRLLPYLEHKATLTSGAVKVLAAAQYKSDYRFTWAEALAAARRKHAALQER